MSERIKRAIADEGEVAFVGTGGSRRRAGKSCGPQVKISRSLAELDWVPRPRLLALRRLGIETVENLLTHFPRRHEDRHEFPHFPREESDVPICLCGEVPKRQYEDLADGKKSLKQRWRSRARTR